MSDTDMVDKFASYLENYTSLAFAQLYKNDDEEEWLIKYGIKITNFELAKQNSIGLLEKEIERIQQNLDYIKTITLENWDECSWTEEERNKFLEEKKQ